jgi:hypothetical protein
MAQPIVLITFYCRTGDTEKLALEAAVGAVQARGLIRLRRLPDLDSAPGGNQDLARMRKEYVPPTEKDVMGADALVLVVSNDFPISSPVWAPFRSLLGRLHDEGQLRSKIGAGIGMAQSTVENLGLTCTPETPIDALAVGRAVVDLVRTHNANTE